MANIGLTKGPIEQDLMCNFQFVSVGNAVKQEPVSEGLPTQTFKVDVMSLERVVKEESVEEQLLVGNIKDDCHRVMELSEATSAVKVEPKDEITLEENNIDVGEGPDEVPTYYLGNNDLQSEKFCTADESPAKLTPFGLKVPTLQYENQNSILRTILFQGDQHRSHFIQCTELMSEIEVEHSKRSHTCHKCGKGFLTQSKFLYHFQIHSDIRPHICEECGKGFTTRRYLTSHLKFHSVKRPHICSECGKGFTSPTLLRAHMKTHSGERPHICTYCGKGFKTRNHLNVHSKIHSGERPHICSKCGKRFISRSNLKSHLIWHSGERSLECDECGKLFSHRSNLISHIKLHSAERSSLYNEFDQSCAASVHPITYLKNDSHIRPRTCKYL